MGATWESAENVAKEADYLLLMLGFPDDVEKTVLGNPDKEGDKGLLHYMKPGAYLIDHTTSSPELARRIAKQAGEKGIFSLDAPVSGGDVGAVAGNLVVMIGGEDKAIEHCTPIMECYSAKCQGMGAPTAGQHTKAVNQIMIASTMIGLCESLIYGYRAGLQLEVLIELLSGGAARSFSLEKLGPRMIRRNFDPGFYVEHFVKDLGIALEEAKRMDLQLPGTALAFKFYEAL